jgi:crotonobetainyl-CoA:carnitine CoA-transferase CaiB-like acyl-CoA transferase
MARSIETLRANCQAETGLPAPIQPVWHEMRDRRRIRGHKMTENKGAFAGIRVVELGQLIAGPFCGQLLGDMGAEVIKVEPPNGSGAIPCATGVAANIICGGKSSPATRSSVSANLRMPEGQEIVRKLIAQADILIENFKPGTIEKWGLGPDVLHAINPRPHHRTRVGLWPERPLLFEPRGLRRIGEAMGGWRYIVGDPDRPPSRMGVSIGDSLAATYGCMGALAALHAGKDRQGPGRRFRALRGGAAGDGKPGARISGVGYIRERSGSSSKGIAPSQRLQCSDGEYLIGANQDAVFARLCTAMGRPELASDPRYAITSRARRNQKELDDLIEAWTRR